MRAFTHLSTERATGMSTGPIPWSAMVAYADREQMDPEAADILVRVISAMDYDYLADVAEQRAERADG